MVQVTKEEFINGIQAEGDKADKESMIRQRLTSAEQFGLMSAQGKLTEAGNRVVKISWHNYWVII